MQLEQSQLNPSRLAVRGFWCSSERASEQLAVAVAAAGGNGHDEQREGGLPILSLGFLLSRMRL